MLTLELIAQVAEQGGDKEIDKLAKDLLSLFSIDGDLLETRGDSIILELCVHLGPEQVFCTMARILEQEKVSMTCCGMGIHIINSGWSLGFGLCKHDGTESQHHSHHI